MTAPRPNARGPLWGLFWAALGGATLFFFLAMAGLYWEGKQLSDSLPDLLLPPPGESDTTTDPAPTEPAPFPVTLPFGLTHRGSLDALREADCDDCVKSDPERPGALLAVDTVLVGTDEF